MTLNISTWEDFKTELQGEEITMQLRKLTREAYLDLLPLLSKAEEAQASAKKDEAGQLTERSDILKITIASGELQEIGLKIFPEHVKDIRGVQIDSKEITGKELASESALTQLSSTVLSQLFFISQLREPDSKNSKGPSGSPPEA